jgi:hypothetical protein
MIRDLARGLLEWLDDSPHTLAITAAGFACLIALVLALAGVLR